MVGVVKCPQCKPVRCAGADFIDTHVDTMAASLPDRQRESAAIVNKDLRRTYNASTRKWLYREYVFLTFGYLGAGYRVTIPQCILHAVREKFPDPYCNCVEVATCTKHYMGHKAAKS
jgi:hypothetical protein